MGTPKWNPGAIVAAAAVAAALAGMASATKPGRGAAPRLQPPCDSAAHGKDRHHSCRTVGWDLVFSPNAPDSFAMRGPDTSVVGLWHGAVYAAPSEMHGTAEGTVVVSQPVLAGSVASSPSPSGGMKPCTGGRRHCQVVLPARTTTLVIGYGNDSAIKAIVRDPGGRRGCQVKYYHALQTVVDSVTSQIGTTVLDTLARMNERLAPGHPRC